MKNSPTSLRAVIPKSPGAGSQFLRIVQVCDQEDLNRIIRLHVIPIPLLLLREQSNDKDSDNDPCVTKGLEGGIQVF